MNRKEGTMEEADYIQLQTLLAKFRVVVMKEYGSKDTLPKIREKDLQIIRRIDYLRNNTILNLYGGNMRQKTIIDKKTITTLNCRTKTRKNYYKKKKIKNKLNRKNKFGKAGGYYV